MIDFKCGGCHKEYSVPVEYAGKKARCKVCNHTNTIPLGGEAKVETEVIVFSCDECGKELKVRQENAGKRVRCPKCKAVCTIPVPVEPEPESEEYAVAQEEDDQEQWEEQEDEYDGFEYSDDISALAAEADGAEVSQVRISDRPTPKISRPKSKSSGTGGGLMEFAKGAGKVPASIGLSILATVAGAIGWTVLTWMMSGGTGTDFYLIWYWPGTVVATLAGVGLVALTDKRNVLLGIVAAVIGLGGMLCGKVLIARFVIMPKMTNPEAIEDMADELRNGDLNEYVSYPPTMYSVLCMELGDKGEIPAELVKPTLAWIIISETQNPDISDDDRPNEVWLAVANNSEFMSYIDRIEEIKAAGNKVFEEYKNLTQAQKLSVLRKHWDPMWDMIGESLREMPAVGFMYALVETFGLLDLLWLPLGMSGAFSVAKGRG